MADNQTTERTPAGALVPTERADPAAALQNQNLDPAKGRVAFWSSLTPTTAREKALLYNAMVGQVKPVAKMIDETLQLTNVVLQGVDLTNAVTGEITPAVRTILVDDNNKMYGAVSKGIHESVKKMIAIMGMPPYDPPVPVIPRAQKAKTGQFFTLEMAGPDGTEPPPIVTQPNPPPAKPAAKK